MPFKELNNVAHYIIHRLSGVRYFEFIFRDSRIANIAYRNTR